MSLFAGTSTVDVLAKAMSVAQDNHRIISNNIANADTPGYSPTKMDFQGTLRNALDGRGRISLRTTRSRHIQASYFQPELDSRHPLITKNDQNRVDLEMEIAELSKNTGKYTTYGSILKKQFQMTKNMLTNTR